MRPVVVVIVIAIAGCKGEQKQSGVAAGFADCTVVAAAIDRLAEKATEEDKPKVPRLKEAMMARCNTDRWSTEAKQCIANAKDRSKMEECEGKLTPEQKEAAKKASADVLGAPVAPGPMPAEAGSGSGSGK